MTPWTACLLHNHKYLENKNTLESMRGSFATFSLFLSVLNILQLLTYLTSKSGSHSFGSMTIPLSNYSYKNDALWSNKISSLGDIFAVLNYMSFDEAPQTLY